MHGPLNLLELLHDNSLIQHGRMEDRSFVVAWKRNRGRLETRKHCCMVIGLVPLDILFQYVEGLSCIYLALFYLTNLRYSIDLKRAGNRVLGQLRGRVDGTNPSSKTLSLNLTCLDPPVSSNNKFFNLTLVNMQPSEAPARTASLPDELRNVVAQHTFLGPSPSSSTGPTRQRKERSWWKEIYRLFTGRSTTTKNHRTGLAKRGTGTTSGSGDEPHSLLNGSSTNGDSSFTKHDGYGIDDERGGCCSCSGGLLRPRRTLVVFLVAVALSTLAFRYLIELFANISRGSDVLKEPVRTVITKDVSGRRVKVLLPFGAGLRAAAIVSGAAEALLKVEVKAPIENDSLVGELPTPQAREHLEPDYGILEIGASSAEADLPAFASATIEFPRIIHQTWKDRESIPGKFKAWAESWQKHHPNWTYHLWTDAQNRGLIATSYPWFLHTYDNLKVNIQKVDSARLFYLHKYGGIYADLDLECLRPLDPLASKLVNRAAVFSMGNKWHVENGDPRHDHDLPNAMMASGTPGHPFWLLCAAMLMDNARRAAVDPESVLGKGRVDMTEGVAGPVLLRRCVMEYRRLANMPGASNAAGGILSVVPAPLVFPYDWAFPSLGEQEWRACWTNSDHFDRDKCLQLQGTKAIDRGLGPFAITYWSKTWAQGTHRVE